MGALCSLTLVSISLIFLISKVMILIYSSQIVLFSNYVTDALTFEDRFSAEDGFFVAAALTKYDSDPEPLDDPRYGELTIEHYSWGFEGFTVLGQKKLQMHSCSD